MPRDFLIGILADKLHLLGVMSAVLSIIAFLPYLIDTARGRTQPERATWLIWSVFSSISFASLMAERATTSLWFAGVQVAGTITVFLISISKGNRQYFCEKNSTTLAIACLGLVLWYFTANAIYALSISITISLVGGIPTILKAYRHPGSETLLTWLICSVASVLALMSVGTFDPVLMAYPFYLPVLYSGIVFAAARGQYIRPETYLETFVWKTRRNKLRLMPSPLHHPAIRRAFRAA